MSATLSPDRTLFRETVAAVAEKAICPFRHSASARMIRFMRRCSLLRARILRSQLKRFFNLDTDACGASV